jgi:hypothetical protein
MGKEKVVTYKRPTLKGDGFEVCEWVYDPESRLLERSFNGKRESQITLWNLPPIHKDMHPATKQLCQFAEVKKKELLKEGGVIEGETNGNA